MHDAWRAWLAVVAGIIAPLAAASALVPLRDTIDNANVALVLAAVVVAVALTGSRAAVLVAAASATVWCVMCIARRDAPAQRRRAVVRRRARGPSA